MVMIAILKAERFFQRFKREPGTCRLQPGILRGIQGRERLG